MKLTCSVEVSNRTHVLPNLMMRRKPQRSCLAIGRQSVKDGLYILLQTEQNKCGTKYKVDNNIDKIYEKFINEGKATIRFIEPPHDLIIQGDPVPLKSFIHVIKLALSKKANLSTLNISTLNPRKMINRQKTKIIIKNNSEYPTLQGFPRTTEELHISGLDRKSFDLQILKLQNLRILNLSNNQIKFLPKDLGLLPNLQELNLSKNNLGISGSKWMWLEQNNIRNTLCCLDLSLNSLIELPIQIGKLNALVNLKISQNFLTYLPQTMGNLISLKYFDVSQNNLQILPGSMKKLRLLLIDISENPFTHNIPPLLQKVGVPTLTEYAARTFLKLRISYNASLIPSTLVKYLDGAKYCVCSTACFEYYIRKLIYFNLSTAVCNVKSSNSATVPFDCFFCSLRCSNFYSKTIH